ncbi:hypothetical protein DCAR_0935132 [Daucus carota subsp. sativus]|uniref:Uncharacterized protein n=1 Tax=Daucus carota subsp. sativus TaxID=79200 RepID=A0A175YGD8_DAUCS|nr:PREDICTED: cell number regulator 2-like [Daucus carota subsp. sativus]WOH15590.1 hypothetical protein DCAR_0935132 [Daucus carota subsp. sativus]
MASSDATPATPTMHYAYPSPWSTGLCECCSDMPSCCLTWCCPCVTFGRIADIVDKGSPDCCISGCLYFLTLITCCSCIYSCVYRTKMREHFLLAESPCGDCVLNCCCQSCALCQEYRELRNRGFDMSLGWEGNKGRQIREVGMTIPVSPAGMMR